jgi:hypothetical protein
MLFFQPRPPPPPPPELHWYPPPPPPPTATTLTDVTPAGAVHEYVPAVVYATCPETGIDSVAPVAVKFVITPAIGTLVPDVTEATKEVYPRIAETITVLPAPKLPLALVAVITDPGFPASNPLVLLSPLTTNV